LTRKDYISVAIDRNLQLSFPVDPINISLPPHFSFLKNVFGLTCRPASPGILCFPKEPGIFHIKIQSMSAMATAAMATMMMAMMAMAIMLMARTVMAMMVMLLTVMAMMADDYPH